MKRPHGGGRDENVDWPTSQERTDHAVEAVVGLRVGVMREKASSRTSWRERRTS